MDINNKKVLTRKNRVKSEGNLNLNFEERQKNYLIKKRKHSNEIKNQLKLKRTQYFQDFIKKEKKELTQEQKKNKK